MNHPEPGEWVPFICGEANPEARRRLSQHLTACDECRAMVHGWKRSLGQLDAWKLPRVKRPGVVLEPWFRWAAAAAMLLVLSVGILVGRFSSSRTFSDELRAGMEQQVRQDLRQEFSQLLRAELAQMVSTTLAASQEQTREYLTTYAGGLEAQRLKDNQAMYSALNKLYLTLKRDLDTVAVNADAGLRNAEEQLVQLAVHTPSVQSGNSTKE